jgi:predicted HTH domain antitoxin
MAIEMYRHERVSLARAAEIAGLCQEGFKNVIAQRGIKRIIHAPSKSELAKEVKLIVG